MRVNFLLLLPRILATILVTLQSLARALRFCNLSHSRAYGWATPNFARRSYVVDIANCLNNDVDMGRRTRASSLDTAGKLKRLKESIEGRAEKLEALHSEFENLTAKDHLDRILNSKATTRPVGSRKRKLEIAYEDEIQTNKLTSPVEGNLEQTGPARGAIIPELLVKESKSEALETHSRGEAESEKGPEPAGGNVNNFRLVEQGECKIPNFANVWNGIANKRNKELAPVDRYGSHCLADPGEHFEFQTLVACMLSSQTKDEVTAACVQSLKRRGLTLENVLAMSVEELDALISKVGFHATKARNIKRTAQILKDKYGGRVPSSKSELESLPGIGPKMANLIQQIAFNVVEGIAVDLHVHRITNRLGWVKTKTPEETRVKLEHLVPRSLWSEINPLLVGFGQTFCTAAGPGCPTCPVNKWCPTGISNLRSRK